MQNKFIKFNESDHSYRDINGVLYKSVTQLLKSSKAPFPTEERAYTTAKARDRKSKELAIKLQVTQEEILLTYPVYERGVTKADVLREWDEKRQSAADRGNRFHKAFEQYDLTQTIAKENLELSKTIVSVNKFFKEYDAAPPEVIFHSEKYRIAGTTDKPCFRTRTRPGTMDFFDYKTNESKGIEYFSKYGNFFLPPIQHLEDCNFNEYAMQLSLYAIMAQEMFGCKVGKLGIIYIPADHENWKVIPVPYMKHEGIALLEDHKSKTEMVDEAEIVFDDEDDAGEVEW